MAISTVLWLLERDTALPYEAIAILAVVILNTLMGYTQQSRAEQAVAALRQVSAARANVIREGQRQSIVATEIGGVSAAITARFFHCGTIHQGLAALHCSSQFNTVAQ